MSGLRVGHAEEKQSPHCWLMAPDKHLDCCNYCHVPKEMRDSRGPNKKPKTVLIWWISPTLFKNSTGYLSAFSSGWRLEELQSVRSPRCFHTKKKCLNQWGRWESRFALRAATARACLLRLVSAQTGFSKCLLWVFTFYLMHSDDTESKHIHTETRALLCFTGTFLAAPSLWVQLSSLSLLSIET